MYEYALGAGYAFKQLAGLVKQLAGPKANDEKTEKELQQLRTDFKKVLKENDAIKSTVTSQGKILNQQGLENESAKKRADDHEKRIRELEKQAHGLKVKLGKSKAENNRLKQ